jgi:hypothetical protein
MPSPSSRTPRGRKAGRPRLEIHVINGGYGESIIVRLPDGVWGVVDCYAAKPTDPETNPTLLFLRENQVKSLEFVCLTHPHDDHFRGMSQLFSSFTVKHFWRFPGLTHDHLVNFVVRRRVEAEEHADRGGLEAINDLQSTLRLVEDLSRTGLQVGSPEVNTVLYPWPVHSTPEPGTLDIRAVAPPGNAVESFSNSLKRCFGADGRVVADAPSLKCNDVSIALLIRYGATRVILGGTSRRRIGSGS